MTIEEQKKEIEALEVQARGLRGNIQDHRKEIHDTVNKRQRIEGDISDLHEKSIQLQSSLKVKYQERAELDKECSQKKAWIANQESEIRGTKEEQEVEWKNISDAQEVVKGREENISWRELKLKKDRIEFARKQAECNTSADKLTVKHAKADETSKALHEAVSECKAETIKTQDELSEARALTEDNKKLKIALAEALDVSKVKRNVLDIKIDDNVNLKDILDERGRCLDADLKSLKDQRDKLKRSEGGLARGYKELEHAQDRHKIKELRLQKLVSDKGLKDEITKLEKVLDV